MGLVLCSDGVCDVAEADDCAAVVASAWERGEDAAAVLTNWAMQVQKDLNHKHCPCEADRVQFFSPSWWDKSYCGRQGREGDLSK